MAIFSFRRRMQSRNQACDTLRPQTSRATSPAPRSKIAEGSGVVTIGVPTSSGCGPVGDPAVTSRKGPVPHIGSLHQLSLLEPPNVRKTVPPASVKGVSKIRNSSKVPLGLEPGTPSNKPVLVEGKAPPTVEYEVPGNAHGFEDV